MQVPDWLRSPVAWILGAVIAAGVIITFTDDTGPGPNPPRHRTVTIHIGPTTKVDNADPDAKPNDVVELTTKAQDVAEDFVEHPGDLVKDKPDAAPLEGTAPQIQEGIVPFPWAADEISGCRTRFLQTNFSQRSVPLSKVVLFELHFTAGPDIPNSRADVDGLTAFGNRASSRVSWHFNMDKDGECDYNVPLRSKAWTIANLNSYTINVEVAGKGESPYLRPAGYRQLASIIDQVRQAYPGIKLRLGATDGNCHPTRGGIDTHWRGGPCSGGHSDIKPQDVVKVIAQIRTATRRLHASRPSKRDVWIRHRRDVHETYQRDCRTHAQRSGKHCAELRTRGRQLDRLIARK